MAGRERFELVNVTPGYVIIERARHGDATRSYFSSEPVAPKEEYREGAQVWHYTASAQSVRFDILDKVDNRVTTFPELLALVYWASCEPESDLYRIGELAHANRISIYVALAYESPEGEPRVMADEKVRLLNQAFNQRVQTSDKKILILPDLFGLHGKLSHGQLMIDFGLTSMTE